MLRHANLRYVARHISENTIQFLDTLVIGILSTKKTIFLLKIALFIFLSYIDNDLKIYI
jgi:hypothetical protein